MPDLREPSERVSPRARLMWTVEAVANSVFTLGVLRRRRRWRGTPSRSRGGWSPGSPCWRSAYTLLMPRWRYAVHRWEVTETAVYTQAGWWSVDRRIAPMSRIQTVDYAEGAFSRMFGLASVTVTTASAAGALEIAALDRTLARELVEQLARRADAVPGDAT